MLVIARGLQPPRREVLFLVVQTAPAATVCRTGLTFSLARLFRLMTAALDRDGAANCAKRHAAREAPRGRPASAQRIVSRALQTGRPAPAVSAQSAPIRSFDKAAA